MRSISFEVSDCFKQAGFVAIFVLLYNAEPTILFWNNQTIPTISL